MRTADSLGASLQVGMGLRVREDGVYGLGRFRKVKEGFAHKLGDIQLPVWRKKSEEVRSFTLG